MHFIPILATPQVTGPMIRTTIATLIAILGGGIAALLPQSSARRLNLLVYTAMGLLLAITALDILPDAKRELNWLDFSLSVLSGIALFWLVSKYVYHLCPSCAIHTFDDAALQRLGQTVVLFMIALGIHATMDGLAVVIGDEITGRPNFGVLAAIAVHKLPEGMALALLLIGAGYSRKRAFWYTTGIELTTELGALAAVLFLRGVSPLWLGLIFGHVGGGFLYLVGTTLGSYRKVGLPSAIPSHSHAHPGHER